MRRSDFQIQTFSSLGWRGNGAVYRMTTRGDKEGGRQHAAPAIVITSL